MSSSSIDDMSNPSYTAREVYGALNAALAEYDLNPIDIAATLTDVIILAEQDRTGAILDARHAGATWDQVGIALRISKQAAHHAYAKATA